MKRLAIASHVALINGQEYDGIGNSLIETMKGLDVDFIMVRHSMEGGLPSEVRHYVDNNVKRTLKLPIISHIAPLRYISEILATTAHFSFREKVDVYIGIDPLNALAGMLLRRLGRVSTCIFYTPDYSPDRFGNKLLNKIYHAIDRYCVRNADEVWSVSTRIQSIRRQMGLNEKKNIFLPNVPPAEYRNLRENLRTPHSLIMYGILDKQLDYEGAIKTVAKLRDEIPDIKLIIVGNGPLENHLMQLSKDLKVSDSVIFSGKQPLKETLNLASRSGIGLALYTGEWGFNYYGDSTKCREYFYFGLPVISTDTHSTVQEIQSAGAGVIVNKDVDAYCRSVRRVLQKYDMYAEASRVLGEKYNGIHARYLSELLK